MLLDVEMRVPLGAGLFVQEDRAQERASAAAPRGRRGDRRGCGCRIRGSTSAARGRACRRSTCSTSCARSPAASRNHEELQRRRRGGGRREARLAGAGGCRRGDRRPRARPVDAARAARTGRPRGRARPRALPARLNDALRRSVTRRWARAQSRWRTQDGLVVASATPSSRCWRRSGSARGRTRCRRCRSSRSARTSSLLVGDLPARAERGAGAAAAARPADAAARSSTRCRRSSSARCATTDAAGDGRRRQPRARRDRRRARERRGALRRAARAGDRRVWRDEIAALGARPARLGPEAARSGRLDAGVLRVQLRPVRRGTRRAQRRRAGLDRRPLRAARLDRPHRVCATTRQELRVTDHKTGRNRTTPRTVIGGGATLQPVLYGLAVEKLLGRPVTGGRLFYCTAAGGFTDHPVPLTEANRRAGLEALEIIDRAIELGFLPPAPAERACTWCDFRPVCGPDEPLHLRRKPADSLGRPDGAAEACHDGSTADAPVDADGARR